MDIVMRLPRLKPGLLRHPLDGQTLVYSPTTGSIHLLDPTTSCVLDLLEETGWTAEGVVSEISDRLGLIPDPAFLELAINELRSAGLLEEEKADSSEARGIDRRDLIRKLALTGAAALLVPAVATLTATPGYAQGTGANIANGQQCVGTNGGSCASGICVTNTGTPTCCGTATKTGKGGTCVGGGNCCSGTCTGGFCA